MHRGSIHQWHPKAPFKSKPCGFDCYTVLAPVSKCYPLLMGRLPTCYSPVRHSSFSGGASSGGKKEAYDLHVLGTPPAFVLSQDQTLIIKVRTILRSLSSICLLAYCLLVKNVCCLESIKTPYTFGLSYFVQFSKVYLNCRSNFYIISECQVNVNCFFKSYFRFRF